MFSIEVWKPLYHWQIYDQQLSVANWTWIWQGVSPQSSLSLPGRREGCRQTEVSPLGPALCHQCSSGLVQPTRGTEGLNQCSNGLNQPNRGIEGLRSVFQRAWSTYQRNRRVKNQCSTRLVQPTRGTEGLNQCSNGLNQPNRGIEGLKPVFHRAQST